MKPLDIDIAVTELLAKAESDSLKRELAEAAGYYEEGPTFDPQGDYLCGGCSFRLEPNKCAIVKGDISMENGGCIIYRHGPQVYQEPLITQFDQDQVIYTERTPPGFGCKRCEYMKEGHCKVWDIDVQPNACCYANEGPHDITAYGTSEGVRKEWDERGRGRKQVSPVLKGLIEEAKKAPTFEEFEHDFLGDIKHGKYWHVTTDPKFQIDPSKGPTDKSSMADGGTDKGKLMITSDLENWTDYYGKSRPYVAEIDMSEVPRDAYHQVSRGFGNEFFVDDPSKAKVVGVMSRQKAIQKDRYFQSVLEKHVVNEDDLKKIYDEAHKSSEVHANHKLDGRTEFRGLDISIETDKGKTRTGVADNGKPWSVTMTHPYGYIRGTEGVDGDHVDCFLGDNEEAENVYVVHALDRRTGKYDEDKCMLGFDSGEEAKKAFLANYTSPKFFGSMDEIPFEKFKEKVLATKDDPKMIEAYGTSEGVRKEWDERGRGEKWKNVGKWEAEIKKKFGVDKIVPERTLYGRLEGNGFIFSDGSSAQSTSHFRMLRMVGAKLDMAKFNAPRGGLEHFLTLTNSIRTVVTPEEVNFQSGGTPTSIQITEMKKLAEDSRVVWDIAGKHGSGRWWDFEKALGGFKHAEGYDPSFHQRGDDLEAAAIFHGVPLEGFNIGGEEMIRAMMSRIPEELLINVDRILADKTLQPKHGKYEPTTKTVHINPLIFSLRQRFGEGQGWVSHPELTVVHEVGHSIYFWMPEQEKDLWRELSGWMVGWKEGQTPNYQEKRPGWPHNKSKWSHRKGVRFTRHYAERNDDEDFADCFAFLMLNKPHQMAVQKRDFVEQLVRDRVKKYPQVLIEGPSKAYGERELKYKYNGITGAGTSEGAVKGWDTRGRGRKQEVKEVFWHGTISDALKPIIEKGLQQDENRRWKFDDLMWFDPERHTTPKGFVYLTKRRDIAEWYAKFKMTFDAVPAGGILEFPDPNGKCCFRFGKPPGDDPMNTPDVDETAAVITMELPEDEAQKLESDPESAPSFDSFRTQGTLPKEYISGIETFSLGKTNDSHMKSVTRAGSQYIEHWDKVPDGDWKQVWDRKTKTLTAGDIHQVYMVWYGKLDDLEKQLSDGDVKAYGTSEGVTKAWDTRGRGRKEQPKAEDLFKQAVGEELWNRHPAFKLAADRLAGKIDSQLMEKLPKYAVVEDMRMVDPTNESDVKGEWFGEGEGGGPERIAILSDMANDTTNDLGVHTIIHETGHHWFSQVLTQAQKEGKGSNTQIDGQAAFDEFATERKRVRQEEWLGRDIHSIPLRTPFGTPYSLSGVEEWMGEGIAAYFVTPETNKQLKNNAPKTYQFVDKLVRGEYLTKKAGPAI